MSGTEPFPVFTARESRQRAGCLPGERESAHPEGRSRGAVGSDPQLPKGQFETPVIPRGKHQPLGHPGASAERQHGPDQLGAVARCAHTRTGAQCRPGSGRRAPATSPLPSTSAGRRVSFLGVGFPHLCKVALSYWCDVSIGYLCSKKGHRKMHLEIKPNKVLSSHGISLPLVQAVAEFRTKLSPQAPALGAAGGTRSCSLRPVLLSAQTPRLTPEGGPVRAR